MSTDRDYPGLPPSSQLPAVLPAGISSPTTEVATYADGPLPEGARLGLKMTPSALLRAFLRRWLLALTLGSLLGGVTGAALWFLRPSSYTSYALLRIAPAPVQLLPNNNARADDAKIYQQTQVALIKSQKTIRTALSKNPEIRKTELLQREPIPEDWLEKELQVGFLEGTDIVRIALSGPKPAELPLVVNAIKDAYLEWSEKYEFRQQANLLKDIETVLEDREETIRKKSEKLEALAAILKTIDPAALTLKQKFALEDFATLKKEMEAINSKLRRLQIELVVVEGNASNKVDPRPPEDLIKNELDRDPDLRLALKELTEKEKQAAKIDAAFQPGTKLAEMRKNENNQEVANARAAYEKLRGERREVIIGVLKERVREESRRQLGLLKQEVTVLQEQKKALDKDVKEKAEDAESIGKKSFELEKMREDIKQANDVISSLRSQRERLSAEIKGAQKRVMSTYDAEEPQTSNFKSRLQMAIAGALGVFALACGLVSFFELRAQRIFSTDEVTQDLGMRVLGSLPALPVRRSAPERARAGGVDATTLLIESIDGIRATLLCDDDLCAHRLLMVTSARSSEGKTTLACHLAASIARMGCRTLLIDADFRKPALHHLFSVPPQAGLSEILAGQVEIGEAVMPSPSPNLYILQAGIPNRETISLLGKDVCRQVFEKLRGQFDFLIIDSSPVLPVADALMLGKNVDSVVLALRRHISQAPLVTAAYERLTALRIKVLGAVVIGESTRFKTYGEYYPLLESHAK